MFGNPTDGALLALSQKLNITVEDTARLEELPFTHERKWMGVKCVSKSTVIFSLFIILRFYVVRGDIAHKFLLFYFCK